MKEENDVSRRKNDVSRRINDVSRRKNYFNIITRLQNSCLITLKEKQKQPLEVQKPPAEVFYKIFLKKNFINLTGKHLF